MDIFHYVPEYAGAVVDKQYGESATDIYRVTVRRRIMPISENEWKKGTETDSWGETIFAYLDDNYPKAYKSTDIVKELFDIEESEIQSAILVSLIVSNLEILIDRGVVEAKVVGNGEDKGITYYRRVEDVNGLER